MRQRVPCFDCKGKKVSAYGKTCETCAGLGFMSDHFEAAISKHIKEVIDATLPQTFLKFSQNL